MKKIYISFVAMLTVASCLGQHKIDRSKAPKAGKAPIINIGEPASFTLDNGLKVFVVENHKLPKVSFQLSVNIQPMTEGEKVGLSDMAGEMLSAGTTDKSKAEIDEEIDFIGASLTTTSNGIYTSSLSKHADNVMRLMSEVMLSPAFPEKELEKKKKRALSGLKSLGSNADAIAGRVIKVLNFGKDHPYGEVQTAAHIKSITIDDCKNYYKTYFRPNISYLVMVGDITPDKAKEMANKYFGKWERQDVPFKKFDNPSSPKGVRVVFVEKPGAVQSVVKVIYPIEFPKGSEDVAAVTVMQGVFGGAFSSRLNMNLREDKAYTYGARGSVRSDKYIGRFSAGASVRNEVTDSTVTQILFEMNKMISENITQEELDRNVNFNNGKFALGLEKDQTIVRFALNIERYGLPSDYYQNYLSRLQKVTLEDVNTAAKKYLKPNDCIILIVGNPEVVDGLKQFDTDGKIEFYDKNGDEVSGEKKELPSGLTAQKVIDDYVLAYTNTSSLKQAAKKLKKIKSISMKSETEIQGMKIDISTKRAAPNMLSQEMNMNGKTMQKTVFNGTTGGTSGRQGNKAFTEEEIAEHKVSSVLHAESKYKELGFKIQLKSIEDVNGKDAYLIEVTDPAGNVENVYFDVDSKLKVYSTSTQESPQGDIEVTTEYSEYKEVGGLLLPHRLSQVFGPQAMDMEVKEIIINDKINKKDFEFEIK